MQLSLIFISFSSPKRLTQYLLPFCGLKPTSSFAMSHLLPPPPPPWCMNMKNKQPRSTVMFLELLCPKYLRNVYRQDIAFGLSSNSGEHFSSTHKSMKARVGASPLSAMTTPTRTVLGNYMFKVRKGCQPNQDS